MLNAIMCVWNEEDIIAASVKHALAQGCERVFIIDNGSTDRTVQQAVRAGAVYQASFETNVFDEIKKTKSLNHCVIELNKQLPDEFNWWLFMDADEFPDFDTGKSIRQTLCGLPQEVRAVGAYHCGHLPTHAPYCVPGFHPVDFMPVGKVERKKIWKFPLLRYDRSKPTLFSHAGAHEYYDNDNVIVKSEARMLIHHFNYRRPEVTRQRLEALVAPDKHGQSRIDWYDKYNPAPGMERSVYHERLETLEQVYAKNRYANLQTEELGYNFAGIKRWYDHSNMDVQAVVPDIADHYLWQGSQAYFLGDFESALFRFNKALELAKDENLQALLLEALHRAYARLGEQGRLVMSGQLKKSARPEVQALADSLE